jgi:16S rRNA (adenine1518-N6/adenine1519-N6)-dimethyltransferase
MSPQVRSEIAELLERHGLAPIHRLGQHFLADANITRKIVSVSDVGPGSLVVEVGAGTGTLTRALAAVGAHVVAYEIDTGLEPVLREVTEGLDVEIRIADVMKADLAHDLRNGEWSLVANLPYNVGTPVLLDALRHAPRIRTFVVMVQKEVADRLTAQPGSRHYGLPSVVCGIHAEAGTSFKVPAQVFLPPPNVDSAVVVLKRIASPPTAERAIELAAAAFNQRRKMIRKSLSTVFDDPVVTISAAGLDPTMRAEDISPAGYLKLAGS